MPERVGRPMEVDAGREPPPVPWNLLSLERSLFVALLRKYQLGALVVPKLFDFEERQIGEGQSKAIYVRDKRKKS